MNTALLLIDLQMELFQIPCAPIHASDAVLANLGGLLRQAREKKIPIIHVQHCGEKFLIPRTPGWDIHPMVRPLDGEVVIEKWTPDAFHETTLQQELLGRDIRRLVIGGLQTEYCIDTTCRRAFSLGYETVLVQDGHSTLDTPLLSAPQIIAHHNQVLGEWFVMLRSAGEVWID